MFDRRSFLSLLPGVAAAPAVADVIVSPRVEVVDSSPYKMPGSHPFSRSMVDALMLADPYAINRVSLPSGDWDILWTGWKDNIWTLERCCQWVAVWPERAAHHMVYCSTPGGFGAIGRGEAMNMDIRHPQCGYLYDRMYARPDVERTEKGDALLGLLELIRVFDWSYSVDLPYSQWKVNAEMKAWETLSPWAKFYFDFSREEGWVNHVKRNAPDVVGRDLSGNELITAATKYFGFSVEWR